MMRRMTISAAVATAGLGLAPAAAAAQVQPPAQPSVPSASMPSVPPPSSPTIVPADASSSVTAPAAMPAPGAGYAPPADMPSVSAIFTAPRTRTIKMEPGAGQLWLISAFDFAVCQHRGIQAWNHDSCGWTEYGSGDRASGSGRYMYELRWPDGKVERGAREISPAADGTEDQAVVFRRHP